MSVRRISPWVSFFCIALCAIMVPVVNQAAQANPASPGAPTHLQTDNLSTPLGIDDPTPQFAWQLTDARPAAGQSAYQLQVATTPELLASKPDAWDSGRISSGQSLGVAYRGSALKPSTRYYWRVLAWDKDGKPYPASETSWWETGLLTPDSWRDSSHANPPAKWIGYQTWEEAAVRKAAAAWVTTPDAAELAGIKQPQQHIAYRLPFTLKGQVRRAVLFVTGLETVSAWVNGAQVAAGSPLPPWKQFPWKKYVQIDVTPQLHTGANSLAVQTIRYIQNPEGKADSEPPPMSATLVAQLADGSTAAYATTPGSDWKVSIHAAEGWTAAAADDASWKAIVPYVQPTGPNAEPLSSPWPAQSVKALRQEFEIGKPVASARLYATALGAYQIFINGNRAGNDVLAPGWTDYRLRIKYQTYDVTSALAQGNNAIAALVAPGWYSTPLEWFQQPNVYGVTPPSLKAMLRIQYTDGSVSWVPTDESWTAAPSPIVKAEIYDGETQDARLIQSGWDAAGFNAGDWVPAEVRTPDLSAIQIDAQDFQPIRVERTLPAKTLTEPKPGTYIVDFGQEFSGVERLHLKGPEGTNIQVRTGEILNSDGTLYTDNLRTALSTDHFILAGQGTEEFQPQFTFHGFRYIEITGLKSKPSLDSIEGIVFHTDAPFTAQLKTGSPMLNQLWSNILWGQRSNFVGVPTDCPQRDERLGWMADAQVFWRTATYNMDLAAFSRKYTADMRGTQVNSGSGNGQGSDPTAGALFGIYAPGISTTNSASGAGWSDAGVIIPWTSWIQTGDKQVLLQNWDAMAKYLAGIEQSNPDHLWKKNAGIGFGDWLSPEGPTTYPLIATASWAYDVTLMQQMAHALGKTEDETRYAHLFEQIKASFIQAFVHNDGFVAGATPAPTAFSNLNNPDAKAKAGDTQTGYVLALHMNLVPDSLRPAVAQHLVNKIQANHGLLGTGFLGTPYLLAVLTESGHRDLAYHLLLNTQYPSWGYLVDHGATTMWERWNGDQMKGDPSMNSYNHYAYGAVADWVYRYAAGIDTVPGDPGFHTIDLHPAFDKQLGSIDFTYPSPYGDIHSAWTVTGSTAQWNLTIPANTTGWLPLTRTEAANYKLSGQPIQQSKLAAPTEKDHQSGFTLPAGSYNFEVSGIR